MQRECADMGSTQSNFLIFSNKLQHNFNLKYEEVIMSKIVHTSRITINREDGPTRKALIEGFSEPVFYGVHGGIKKFYGLEPRKEHAATLDHIIGGVGG